MFRSVTGAALALIAVCGLLAPVPRATAQGAPPVAALDGYELGARVKDGDLCMELREPEDPSLSSYEDCERAPAEPFAVRTIGLTSTGPVVALGVADTVAVVDAGSGPVPTVAVPGATARVVLLRAVTADTLVRLLDARGRLIGAWQPDGLEDEVPGARTVVRTHAVRIALRPRRLLSPTPLQLDRTIAGTCVIERSPTGGGSSCEADDDLTGDVEVYDDCAPRRAVVAGLVDAGTRGVVVTLGSGRRLRAGTTPVPPGLPGRTVAVRVPRGEAVRAIRYVGADGRSTRQPLGHPPTGTPCDSPPNRGSGVGLTLTDLDPLAALVEVSRASATPLRAGDGPQDTLCTAIGKTDPSCSIPPVSAEEGYLDRQGRVFGGVLAAGVDRVRVRLDDGRRFEVAATPGPATIGRYAGLVRFVAFAAPPGRFVRRVTALGADGRILARVFHRSIERSARRRTRLGGGLVLTRTTTVADGRRSRTACVSATGGLARFEITVCGGSSPAMDTASAVASCRPRRLILFGTVAAGGRSVRVRLAGGRTRVVAAKRIRGVGRVWRLTLPARVGLRGVRVGSTDQDLRLPPAARQCGYSAGGRFG